MLQFIMEKNVLLYLLAAACVVGVVSQMILRQIYEGLMKDTKMPGEPEGRFLQQLRQRFQYCTHLNEQVGDVQALIQKNLLEYRFWGMGLHTWKRIGAGCLTVSILCAFAGTVARVQGGASVIADNTYFWMGVGAAVLTILAYGISDTGFRRDALEIRLCDYLENSGAVRDYSASDEEDLADAGYDAQSESRISLAPVGSRRTKRRAKAETAAAVSHPSRAQREKAELRENLARVKAGMQETAAADSGRGESGSRAGTGRGAEILRQMDPKEQERILREVLQEFLA